MQHKSMEMGVNKYGKVCKNPGPVEGSRRQAYGVHDIMVEGESHGNTMTLEDICCHGAAKDDKESFPPSAAMVLCLPCKQVTDISMLNCCSQLQICNLSCNFIRNIEALKFCHNLVCLDLHSNQLEKLPGQSFWSNFLKLQTVYLHDNCISRVEDVKSLSSAIKLHSLTLFDTPVSLTKNYRHCVVNAIWSLCALDNCVVSDEEIIEDAKFPTCFKTLQPHFFFSPLYLAKKETDFTAKSRPSYTQQLAMVWKDIAIINKIHGKFSPVLILQRVVRGFLTRLRYQYLLDSRLWAAVSIQRFYREYKGYSHPPPSTPNAQLDSIYQSMSSMHLDFESYLQLRRSKHKSMMSFKSANKLDLPKASLPKTQAIHVDLGRLKTVTVQAVHFGQAPAMTDQGQPAETDPSVPQTPHQSSSSKRVPGLEWAAPVKDKHKVGKYFTQYKFLGEVVETVKVKEDDSAHAETDERGNVSAVGFRLTVRPPPVMSHDMLEELILRTIEGADDIRQSVKEINKQLRESEASKPILKHSGTCSRSKRELSKAQGTMNLARFRAVDRAYRERQLAEVAAQKALTWKAMRKKKQIGKDKCSSFLKQYRNRATANGQASKLAISDALAEREDERTELQERIRAQRAENIDRSMRIRADYEFAAQFCCQNASIGKALQSHATHIQKLCTQQDSAERISQVRKQAEEQHEGVKMYMEHTRLVRQAENMAERENLKSILQTSVARRELGILKFIQEKNLVSPKQVITPTTVRLKEARPFTG